MDKHSQSSDVFTDSGDHCEYSESPNMDIDSFSSLISSTKLTLSKIVDNEVHKPNFSTQFTSAVEDCDTCIAQGLGLITNLLSDQNLQLDKLQGLIEDTVSLLQLLANYLKNVVQSISMACCHFAIVPITTGHIIFTVFTHCRDSETLYGHHLKIFENELKNLFRTCHELQVTYLMILDKHFTFDLTKYEEMVILIEALEINLKIGEIVQSLDVKTMAEQWKGYTVLCEKYATSLMDKDIFDSGTKILCSMIENNIRTAAEMDLEEKAAVRSVKVASFTIKIMLKVCNIFKQATVKSYDHVLGLLLCVFLNTSSYLGLTAKKSPQFISMMVSNVLTPCELLLKELLLDPNFTHMLVSIDLENLPKEDERLGYGLLTLAAIKLALQGNPNICKEDLINSVYKFLPYGHIWLNIGLKFNVAAPTKDKETCGLYEHLLSHVYALATTLSSEEMMHLEEIMFKAVLGIDCYCALFSANLWSLIAKISTPQYLRSQMSCLLKIFEELERDYIPNGWSSSPQRVHFKYLLRTLSHILKDKKHFGFEGQSDGMNLSDNGQDDVTWNGLNKTFEKICSSAQPEKHIYILNKYMHLTPPCDPKEKSTVAETIVKAWTKACPNKKNALLQIIEGQLNSESALYLDCIGSLAAITMSLQRSKVTFSEEDQIKILHVVSSLIQHGNMEMRLTLMNLLFELTLNTVTGNNSHIAESIIVLTFRSLFQENNTLVRESFYNALRKHKENRKVTNIITNVIADDKLKQIWDNLMNLTKSNITNTKDQFLRTMHLKYVHRCLENSNSVEVIELSDSNSLQDMHKTSNNFDFADIDTLFEVDSDSEPACKKFKLNTPNKHESNEVRDIIIRLENDTEYLCQVKENVFSNEYKSRIREVCEKLHGIAG